MKKGLKLSIPISFSKLKGHPFQELQNPLKLIAQQMDNCSRYPQNIDFNFVQIQKTTDQLGQVHYRYNQHYKGIEIIGAQFILHNKNGFIQ